MVMSGGDDSGGDDSGGDDSGGDVSCVVCETNYHHQPSGRQPVALPACGHSFCRACLTSLRHRHGPNFLCPACRRPHQGEDITNLPTNYLALSLISKNNTNYDEETDKTCLSEVKNQNASDPLIEHPEKMELKKTATKENEADLAVSKTNILDPNIPNLEKSENQTESDEDNTSPPREPIENTSRRTRWRPSWRQKLGLIVLAILLGLVGLGAGIAIAVAPAIISSLGFTAEGLTKDSYASRLMSSTAKDNNGTIPKDSMMSWLQQAGHKGLQQDHHTYFGLSGAGLGLGLAVLVLGVLALVLGVRQGCWRDRRKWKRDRGA